MAIARLLQRGQLTIPQEVRDKLKLGPGDVVRVEVTGPNSFEVRRLPSMTLDEIRTYLQGFEQTGLSVEEAIAQGQADAADEYLSKLDRETAEATA